MRRFFLVLSIAFTLVSCNKDYICECDNGTTTATVEAASESEAQGICDTKGVNCKIYE